MAYVQNNEFADEFSACAMEINNNCLPMPMIM